MSQARYETTPGTQAPLPLRRRAPALPPLRSLVAVAAGGVIGASLRVGFSAAFPNLPGHFPWTTFAENVSGSFLLGLLLVLLLEHARPAPWLRPFLCTGILGSFTTFSMFTVEIMNLAGSERLWLVVVYPAASIFAGLVAAWLGIAVARRWPPFVRRKDRS